MDPVACSSSVADLLKAILNTLAMSKSPSNKTLNGTLYELISNSQLNYNYTDTKAHSPPHIAELLSEHSRFTLSTLLNITLYGYPCISFNDYFKYVSR